MPWNYTTAPADGAAPWGNWLRGVLSGLKGFVDGVETSVAAKADTTALTSGLAGKANTTHTHVATAITDSTAVGRSVLTASSTSAARTAIGAGTGTLTSPNSSFTGIAYYASEAALPATGTAGVLYVIPAA